MSCSLASSRNRLRHRAWCVKVLNSSSRKPPGPPRRTQIKLRNEPNLTFCFQQKLPTKANFTCTPYPSAPLQNPENLRAILLRHPRSHTRYLQQFASGGWLIRRDGLQRSIGQNPESGHFAAFGFG